jgi:diguanylate cyclase (GGDEF)-like protein/PAS domain S-box-containing protein
MTALPSSSPAAHRDAGSGPDAQQLDADAVEHALRALQDRHPRGPLLAVSANGLIAELPDSVPRRENPVLKGRAALDGVFAEDRQGLMEAFDRVLACGLARCWLRSPSFGRVEWHGFDLRERHGVIIGMLATDAGPDSAEPIADEREMARVGPPRLATMRKNERSVIVEISDGITEILGWSAEEMVGHRTLEFVHPDDHSLAIDNWMEMLAHAGPSRRIRQRLRHRNGSWVWFEVTNHNLLEDPGHRCAICELVDISEEMAAQEALRAREQLLNRIAEAVPVGLLQIDTEGRIVYTNDRLHEIVGVERAATVEAQLRSVVPDDRTALEQAVAEVLDVGSHADLEVACRQPEAGEVRYCTVSFRTLLHDDGIISGAIACIADITESARMREELKFRATFDQLTGCHNRASIMAALEADIARARRRAERAVMFVDLDNFKSVNDRHGHAAGDELLRSIARLLGDSIRKDDLIGRVGGDEFLIICPEVGGPDQAMGLAGRLAAALRRGAADSISELTCTASIGVAWSADQFASADALVAAADQAMYESKRAGNGEPKLA